MIYTVTLNPAIDYFITLNNPLMVDEVNRGSNELFKAGGKGLNVSRILSILGVPSSAIAVLGGFTGRYIAEEFEKDSNIHLVPVVVEGVNRVNVKVHHNNSALCINGEGPTASETVKRKISEILQHTTSEDIVLLSGSMMKGFTDEDLVSFADIIHTSGAKLVIDMEHLSMELLRKCRPWLIKPDLYEFELLMKSDTNGREEEILHLLARALDNGPESILLSLGKDGAIYADSRRAIKLDQPSTPLVNKVGAGDAMLAAFIGKSAEGETTENALLYGGAAGNAVASKLEDITLQDIETYLPYMHTSERKIDSH